MAAFSGSPGDDGMSFETGDCPYVVEISTVEGVLLFKGTVSQQGDFIHMHRYPNKSVATLRVHDMAAAAKKAQAVEKLKLIDGMSGT